MPRGRYRQKQWETRQVAILDALENLSTVRGFVQVTMDDVADEVGISKATLYQHFESKDAMLTALMVQRADQFQTWLETSAGQQPFERLHRTMRYLMEGQITPLRGLINLGREEITPVFRNTPSLVAQHAQIIDLLADIVAQGQAQGEIAPDLSPYTVISAMWALSNVSMADTDLPEDYTAQMIALFERGIRPV